MAIVTSGSIALTGATALAADPAAISPVDSSSAGQAPSDELAASTAAPWVPSRPVPAAEGWETVLGLPGRIASLPLSGLGYLTRHTLIVMEETNFIQRVLVAVAILPSAGVLAGPAALGDRTGLGISLGASPPGLKGHLTARWDGSTRKYSRTRVEARWGPARLDYGYEWRPREHFYGFGPSSSADDTSTFASQSQQARFGLVQRFGAPDRPWNADLAAWIGPREMVVRHGREAPSVEERFPSTASLLDQRVEHLVYGGRAVLDSRRGAPHWSHGVRVSVEAQRFDRPIEALALRTTRVPLRFTRMAYEAEGGASFYRDPRTLRLKLQVVDNIPDGSGTLLLSDQATLGGRRGLQGFAPGRFHDVDAVVGRLSYVFPLAWRVEFDAHVEAGAVQGDVWRHTRASALEHSFGIELRPRLDNAVLGAIGVDWSDESVRLHFSFGGVE